ncbi:MAG: hypothetical protein ACREFY_17905 [Acetobacteraceae bacterium]
MSSCTSFRLLSAMALGLGLACAPMSMARAASHTKSATNATATHSTALHGYKTEAEAKTGCTGDTVVWRARGSKVFHTSGSKYFGKTKHGSFVCAKAATAKGLHAAKS